MTNSKDLARGMCVEASGRTDILDKMTSGWRRPRRRLCDRSTKTPRWKLFFWTHRQNQDCSLTPMRTQGSTNQQRTSGEPHVHRMGRERRS